MKTRYLAFLIPLLMCGCADTDPQQLKERLIGGTPEERVIPVGILCIDTTEGIVSNTYPGYLEEGQSIDLAFKHGGTLEAVYVKEGSRVGKGQAVAKVSSPTLESALRTAQATLEQAQDAYERLKKVHDNGSLPEIKWKEMEANLEKAQSSYDLAQSMMADNLLTSPIPGTIAGLDVKLGENIAPLKPVARVINTQGIAVRITVPEEEIAKLHVGDTAEVVIPALENRRYQGRVTEKSMTASLVTHSYPVKVVIERPDKELVPGMIGKVVLKADLRQGIVIPANAVLLNQEGKFVWVEENGRATRRSVTLSGYSGKGVIVSEGLHPGDKVIVEGYQKVSEGMRVNGERKTENGKITSRGKEGL